jgi:uncharacterized protein
MTVITSFPGVYVEEESHPSVSVNPLSTAVPVIVFDSSFSIFDTIKKYNSYLEFATKVSYSVVNQRDAGIKAYFDNGGGPFYAANTNSLLQEVPLCTDITLIVANGCDIDDHVSKLCLDGSNMFALLDGPNSEITSGYANTYTPNRYAAVYYPWLKASWTETLIAPSAVMAGIFCAMDRSRGIWKAPANVALSAGMTPQYKVSDAIQGQFNTGCAINMIRTFEGRGTVVWGARTLEDSDNWRYIPVRRLFDSVERDLKKAMKSMVFEPNTPPTWEKVRTAITNYMHSLWRQGALRGATEKQAYFVQIRESVLCSMDRLAPVKQWPQKCSHIRCRLI